MYVEDRPWGSFLVMEEGPSYKVKRIVVNPGQRLSYQSHKKRDELWMVVKGVALVTIDGKDNEIKYGKSVKIKKNQKHRVENREKDPLVFIEIQTGEYFGEDDIIRYQDDYKRS
jgi:mannose-6-phosphate isomerase